MLAQPSAPELIRFIGSVVESSTASAMRAVAAVEIEGHGDILIPAGALPKIAQEDRLS